MRSINWIHFVIQSRRTVTALQVVGSVAVAYLFSAWGPIIDLLGIHVPYACGFAKLSNMFFLAAITLPLVGLIIFCWKRAHAFAVSLLVSFMIFTIVLLFF